MILDAFTLAGKVAMVTGCDTGLGQGMAIALAQAGCDIVGVNRKIPDETAARVTALGRRFIAIRADLGKHESIQSVVDTAVTEMAASIFWLTMPAPFVGAMRWNLARRTGTRSSISI